MKKYILFFIILAGWHVYAQPTVPISTFNATGGAMTTFTPGTNHPGQVGSFGQPFTLSRATSTNSGSGVLTANNLMFATSTVDGEAPVITSASLTLTKNATSNIQVLATDNIGITSVKVYHRPIAAGGTYDSSSLSLTSGTNKDGTYGFNVNTIQDEYDDMGMEYYVKVYDSRNSKRSPLTGTSKASTNFTSLGLPDNVINSFGIEVNDYYMLSFPFEPASSAVSTVYSVLNSRTPQVDFRLFRYGSGAYQEYPADFTVLERSRGYFFIAKAALGVVNMGNQIAPGNHRSDLEQIPLQIGWNLIGNPYPVMINWGNVKTLNGFTTDAIRWNGSDWVPVTDILPFQGVFVFANSATNLTIPFHGQTAPGGRTEDEFSTNLAEEKWLVKLNLMQGAIDNSLNGVGMHPEASVETDRFDFYHPPRFAHFAELQFPHPQHMLGSFARDVVPTKNEFVWRFTAETSTEDEAELHWNNSDFGNNKIELYLYDVRSNKIINMREEDRYAFAPGQSKEFKVYYGVDIREKIGPDQIEVFAPYPNPFGLKEFVKIAIGLPEGTPRYLVEMVIRNSMGQPVFNYANDLTPGVHTVSWDGRQPNGDAPAQGFYVYTVKVGNRNFTGKILFLNNQ